MTKKRFISEDDCCGYYTEIIDNKKELDLSLYNPKKNLTIEELVDLLNELHEENRRLKSQLCYNGSDVCDICKHQYLVKSENYYIAKCEKGHDECSKDYLKYCKDFDIKVKE